MQPRVPPVRLAADNPLSAKSSRSEASDGGMVFTCHVGRLATSVNQRLFVMSGVHVAVAELGAHESMSL